MNTDLLQQDFIKIIDLNYVEFLSWNFEKGSLEFARGLLNLLLLMLRTMHNNSN